MLRPTQLGCLTLALGLGLCGVACGAPEVSVSAPAELTLSVAPYRVTGEATLLLMSDIRGVLRPCGCTVELQKGGFDRLAPALAAERERHPGSVLLHAGPLLFDASDVSPERLSQRARQVEVVAELVARSGFDLLGLSTVDLVASHGAHLPLYGGLEGRVTTANVRVPGLMDAPGPWVGQVGDLTVAVFGLAPPLAPVVGVEVSDPRAAAREVVAAVRDHVDVVVLLSGLGLRETKRLLRKTPGIDFAVAGGMGDEPVHSDQLETVGTARLVALHREGRYLGRLEIRLVAGQSQLLDGSAPSAEELAALDRRIQGLQASLAGWAQTLDPGDRRVRSARHHLDALRAQRAEASRQRPVGSDRSRFSFRLIPLNWDLPQDPEILGVMKAFDAELKEIHLANAGQLPPLRPDQATYIGVEACLDCHDETTAYWTHDRHSHAWETLEDDGKTFDAECVSCHVTGYGQAGGSLVGQTEGREDVQCEACHGPGSKHAEAEDDAEIVATIVRNPTEDVCVACHNKHHSPRFDFTSFRDKLLVPGHGRPL